MGHGRGVTDWRPLMGNIQTLIYLLIDRVIVHIIQSPIIFLWEYPKICKLGVNYCLRLWYTSSMVDI